MHFDHTLQHYEQTKGQRSPGNVQSNAGYREEASKANDVKLYANEHNVLWLIVAFLVIYRYQVAP